MTSVDWDRTYSEIAALLREPPDLKSQALDEPAVQLWLGRILALLSDSMMLVDEAEFRQESRRLSSAARPTAADRLMAIAYRMRAKSESRASSAKRGSFLPTGASFDVISTMGVVVSSASSSVMFVDPYVDHVVLTDFAPLAPERVEIKLLSDTHDVKPTLMPHVERWRTQYSTDRQIEARLTDPRQLHDRLIIIDSREAWTITQSFKDLAGRSPSSIERPHPDIQMRKIDAFGAIWASATPL